MASPYLILVGLLLTLPLLGNPSRGTWFWNSTSVPGSTSGSLVTSPHSSSLVVGNPGREDSAIHFLRHHHVDRLYGHYKDRPSTQPAVIASWNRKLAAAGIESQLLIDGTELHVPTFLPSFLAKLDTRLISFNAAHSQDPSAQFKALHLDLEPQASPSWSTLSPTAKRSRLSDLLATYQAVRSHLDTAGLTHFPIYADIPFWFDKLPTAPNPGSIGWANQIDRDNWFTSVHAALDGITIMTFSKTSASSLADATSYERTSHSTNRRIIAIQPRLFNNSVWGTYGTFRATWLALESIIPRSQATDIENYALWRHAHSTQPFIAHPPRRSHLLTETPDLSSPSESAETSRAWDVDEVAMDFSDLTQVRNTAIIRWIQQHTQRCIISTLAIERENFSTPADQQELLAQIQEALLDYNSSAPTDAQVNRLRLILTPKRDEVPHIHSLCLSIQSLLVGSDVAFHLQLPAQLDSSWNNLQLAQFLQELTPLVDRLLLSADEESFYETFEAISPVLEILGPLKVGSHLAKHSLNPDLQTLNSLEQSSLDSPSIHGSFSTRNPLTPPVQLAPLRGLNVQKSEDHTLISFTADPGYTYSLLGTESPAELLQSSPLLTHVQEALPPRTLNLQLPLTTPTAFYQIKRKPIRDY